MREGNNLLNSTTTIVYTILVYPLFLVSSLVTLKRVEYILSLCLYLIDFHHYSVFVFIKKIPITPGWRKDLDLRVPDSTVAFSSGPASAYEQQQQQC